MLMLELVIRVWGYAESNIYDPIYTAYPQSEDIPYIHKPNLKQARARGLVIFDTDKLGLRSLHPNNSVLENSDLLVRVALLGDSVTFGEGVSQTKDTFCQVAEDQLNQNCEDGTFLVYNFGVSAYSVQEMAATARERIQAVSPDLVIMALIPDDFNLGRTPEVDKYGYHYNQQLSGFISKDSIFKRALRKVRISYLFRNLINQLRYMNSDQGTPEAIEVKLLLPDSFAFVRAFVANMQQQNLEYLILLLPSNSNSDFDPVAKALENDSISYLDLRGIFDQFTLDDFNASAFNRHPSALVHQTIGQDIAEYIIESKAGFPR